MLDEKGQSLLEVVIALAVIVMIVGALTFATISSIRNAQSARDQSQATKLAQEGIEWVRTSRDRNSSISINLTPVTSWNGDNSSCPGNSSSIWCYQLSGGGLCEDEQPSSVKCYFTINSAGVLTNIGFRQGAFPTAQAEAISSSPTFYRAIILSDDTNEDKNFSNDTPQTAKKVTSVVQWNDFSGTHQSKLTTILRKL